MVQGSVTVWVPGQSDCCVFPAPGLAGQDISWVNGYLWPQDWLWCMWLKKEGEAIGFCSPIYWLFLDGTWGSYKSVSDYCMLGDVFSHMAYSLGFGWGPRRPTCVSCGWWEILSIWGASGAKGFPGGSVVMNLPSIAGMWVWTLGPGRSLEKEWQHSCILPGEVHGQKSSGLQSVPWRVRHDLAAKQHPMKNNQGKEQIHYRNLLQL